MMNAIPTEPCAHPGCGCKVASGQQFCSDDCREQGKQRDADTDCSCGHSDCIVEEALHRMDQ